MTASGRVEPAHTARLHRYRSIVIAALERFGAPASAQDIYALIRADGARIGLSTVYRELHTLVRQQRIYEVRVGAEVAYQASRTDLLICDGCGRTQELPRHGHARAEVADFFSTNTIIAVHGRCRECSTP